MKTLFTSLSLSFLSMVVLAQTQDTLQITAVGHGSVMFEYASKVIHVDPSSRGGNYTNLPDADLIFITHHHGDHYDPNVINQIKKDDTHIYFTQRVMNDGAFADGVTVLANGDSIDLEYMGVKVVPAYNYEEPDRHVKGECNGYIFNFGETRVYTAGDTEDIPEMATFADLDIAFIPMNQPFTMTAAQAANAANMLNPKILHIYHHEQSRVAELQNLLSDAAFEIRVGAGTFSEPEKKKADTTEVINEPELSTASSGFKVYPNPSSGLLHIQSDQLIKKLTLTNLSGQRVYAIQLQSFRYQDNLNHLGLDKGIYLLTLETDLWEKTEVFVYR